MRGCAKPFIGIGTIVTLDLVMLTLNERAGLEAVFDRLPREAVREIFAVDGGSTDGTLEFLREKNIRAVGQSKRGRGEAMRMAFGASNAEALIFFSPDGNENPADVPRFKPYLEQGYDLVIASRMMTGAVNEEDGQVLKLRKWANLAFDALANWGWNRGAKITDCINGYRAITRRAFDALALDEHGFTIEYQMTIRAFKKNLRVVEFPTTEGQRVGRESGAKALPVGTAFLKLLVKEWRRTD